MKNDIPFWMDPFYLLHLQKMGPSLNQGVIISVTCRVDQAKRIHHPKMTWANIAVSINPEVLISLPSSRTNELRFFACQSISHVSILLLTRSWKNTPIQWRRLWFFRITSTVYGKCRRRIRITPSVGGWSRAIFQADSMIRRTNEVKSRSGRGVFGNIFSGMTRIGGGTWITFIIIR